VLLCCFTFDNMIMYTAMLVAS